MIINIAKSQILRQIQDLVCRLFLDKGCFSIIYVALNSLDI